MWAWRNVDVDTVTRCLKYNEKRQSNKLIILIKVKNVKFKILIAQWIIYVGAVEIQRQERERHDVGSSSDTSTHQFCDLSNFWEHGYTNLYNNPKLYWYQLFSNYGLPLISGSWNQ